MAKKKWIGSAIGKKGAFSASAKRAGMSTSAYARKVLSPSSRASTTTKRRARLYMTLRSFKHK